MAKFAIVGLFAFASLVLSVTAQSGLDLTRIDDSDYDIDGSASGDHDPDFPPDAYHPLISEDPQWKERICERYRSGAYILVFK